MKKMKLFIGIVAASLALAGCSAKYSAGEIMQSPALSGKATQAGKLKGQATALKVEQRGEKLLVSFPELRNHMGKDLSPSPCESEFSYKGSYENSADGTKAAVYFGSWPSANNNCALYVERRSAHYSNEASPRYVILEKTSEEVQFLMSWDSLGREPIVRGLLR